VCFGRFLFFLIFFLRGVINKFTQEETEITMTFYGIADAHGIESFKPVTFKGEAEGFAIDPKELSILGYRANANRHRHAVVFQADVDREEAKEILELIDKGEYIKALDHLKANANDVSLMKVPGAEKSWRMIPNPDLDPYHE